METTMRKLQQRYRRAIEEMEKWDEQQAALLSSFTNASSIIDRLEVLGASKNYGSLQNVIGIKEALLAKQLESLETYFCQMRQTLKEFHRIVKSLDKIARDANQLVKSGSSPTSKQMQLRVGTWSSLKDCLVGLRSISEMHQAEFALKSTIVSSLTWKCSSSEIADLRRLLIDQPNIPKDEENIIWESSLGTYIRRGGGISTLLNLLIHPSTNLSRKMLVHLQAIRLKQVNGSDG